jgi:hypothetical protein
VDSLDEARAIPKLRLEAAQGGMVGDQLVNNPGLKAKSGTPAIPKCPIRLVGRQGLEPWTR